MVIVTVGPAAGITTAPVSIFTPPSSCSTAYTYEAQQFNSIPNGLLLQNALGTPQVTQCFPSGVTVYGRVSKVEWYSPGMCPVGYTTPAQYVNGPTTSIVCCPSGLTYTSTANTILQGPTKPVPFAGCVTTLPFGSTTSVVSYDTSFNLLPASVSGPITMWAQALQFAFQSTDISLFSTRTSTSSPTSSVTSTSAAAASTTSSTSLETSGADSSGLSTGAKAGIGVGVAIAGLLFIAAVIFFLLGRRRQKKRSAGNGTIPFEDMNHPQPYIDDPKKVTPQIHNSQNFVSQLPAEERAELGPQSPQQYRVSEMPANRN